MSGDSVSFRYVHSSCIATMLLIATAGFPLFRCALCPLCYAQAQYTIPVPHYLLESIPETMVIDELVYMLTTFNRRKTKASCHAARNNGRVSPIQRSLG